MTTLGNQTSWSPTENNFCECLDPLDDTFDVRWVSLISITMRDMFLTRRIT